ncbi:MAG: nuclear transport factor 2 family protein [Novosphingobium sp.]|nr:nuclear transport factor 2 family protein [Novosphingobium sp.]
MDPIEEFRAIEEIRQLKSRYFRFVDTKDWEGLATLFCEDAVFDTRGAAGQEEPAEDGPQVSRGRKAIVRYISEGLQHAVSVHHGHGHEVTIDSSKEAHGVIAMEDFVEWQKPFKASLRGYGHYHEVYRIEDGAWQISKSTLTRLRVDTDLPAEAM